MDDEPDEMGIPEWVVTFGDMMSLLLTFFIMLVSLSEIKEEETYQALVDSMQRQFGYQKTIDSLSPGKARPRQAAFTPLATTGRAKRKDTATGGVEQKAPSGEDPMVRIIRPGAITAVGGVVNFGIAESKLDDQAKRTIARLAETLRGRPQKIEIRGHATRQVALRSGEAASLRLAIDRALKVQDQLVREGGVDADRIRVSGAGASEPMDLNDVSRNARVEVFLLDETVEDLEGTPEDRQDATLASPQA
ncbi:MAG: OmpA family protein [Planctomycetota bacterium]